MAVASMRRLHDTSPTRWLRGRFRWYIARCMNCYGACEKRPCASEKIGRIRSYYESRLATSAEGHRVLGWENRTAQDLRFEVLVQEVPLSGRRLLDVGCGIADLWAYVEARGIDVRYTGVDVSPGMVARARERFAGIDVRCVDVFESGSFADSRFHVVFASGIFNLDLGNNYRFLERAVHRFLSLGESHVVFNLLHRRSPEPEEPYFYYDPEKVTRMLSQYPCRVRVVDDYLPNDFTVICSLDVPATGSS